MLLNSKYPSEIRHIFFIHIVFFDLYLAVKKYSYLLLISQEYCRSHYFYHDMMLIDTFYPKVHKETLIIGLQKILF